MLKDNYAHSEIKKFFIYLKILLPSILFFFTFIHPISAKTIKVLLSESPSFHLSVTSPFKISDIKDRSVFLKGNYLPNTKVHINQNSSGLKLNGFQKTFKNGLLIDVKHRSSISINGLRYRGEFEITLNPTSNMIRIINHVDTEDYLKSVVARESPYFWPEKLLHVQAIISRSYAYNAMNNNKNDDFDLLDSIHSQVYTGKSSENPKVSRAVEQTKGQVLLFQNKLFSTFYHSSCGGKTESSHNIWSTKMIPLTGKECGYCDASPDRSWKKTLSNKFIQKSLFKKLLSLGAQNKRIKNIKILERSPSGRALWVKVTYSNGKDLSLSGNTFRLKVGPNLLKSTLFNVRKKGKSFIFTGSGWGHGVGLCQWGAKKMSQDSRFSASDILEYYYPQTHVDHISKRLSS
ncbi:hypothetical protein AB834_05755 [PVC group bacterium (ex Bugula neritina AB1)]|nr:hypothetical protein AB834_05755 [PVC group bacterium (ex Bugula neritina AB1)]